MGQISWWLPDTPYGEYIVDVDKPASTWSHTMQKGRNKRGPETFTPPGITSARKKPGTCRTKKRPVKDQPNS